MSIYKDLAEEYFKCVKYQSDNHINFLFSEDYKKDLKKLRNYTTSSIEYLKDLYDKYDGLCKLSRLDYTEWFKYIIDYNKFLNYLAYAYACNITRETSKVSINSDGTGIFVEKKVKSETNKRTIEIKFEDSEILQIGIDSSTDPLSNFIENGSNGTPNNTVTFVTIIVRTDYFTREYKFVIGEEPDIKEEDDLILLENIKNFVSETIKFNFISLLESLDIISSNSNRISFTGFMDNIIEPQINGGKKLGILWF